MPISPPKQARIVFQGTRMTAYQWEQALFNGKNRTFECCTRPDSAAVIPFLDKNTVLLTHQEQPGRVPFIDMPGGCVDEGETMEQAAKREMSEETGYEAKQWMKWSTRKYQGQLRFEQSVFLASGLIRKGPQNTEADGERIELVPTLWQDVVRMCLKGELRSQETMLAILAMEYHPELRARLNTFLSS